MTQNQKITSRPQSLFFPHGCGKFVMWQTMENGAGDLLLPLSVREHTCTHQRSWTHAFLPSIHTGTGPGSGPWTFSPSPLLSPFSHHLPSLQVCVHPSCPAALRYIRVAARGHRRGCGCPVSGRHAVWSSKRHSTSLLPLLGHLSREFRAPFCARSSHPRGSSPFHTPCLHRLTHRHWHLGLHARCANKTSKNKKSSLPNLHHETKQGKKTMQKCDTAHNEFRTPILCNLLFMTRFLISPRDKCPAH